MTDKEQKIYEDAFQERKQILKEIQEIKENVLRSSPPVWMTTEEAASYVGVSRPHFEKLSKYELLPAMLGKRKLYNSKELDKWLNSRRVEILNSGM